MAQASTFATAFVAAVESKIVNQAPNSYTGMLIEPGVKFDRIALVNKGRGMSCHAFVERATGNLIKSAGWAGPAKGKNGLAIRYHLADPTEFAAAVTDAEFTGGYLYEGRQASLQK